MMIVKVKIAPVEHWCDWAKSNSTPFERNAIVGKMAEIFTESCSHSLYCDGRLWHQTQVNVNELRKLFNRAPLLSDDRWLCEHMLEMD